MEEPCQIGLKERNDVLVLQRDFVTVMAAGRFVAGSG
jgi:hypothetical protein